MLIWGSQSRSIEVGPAASRSCPRCERERPFRLRVSYRYHHLWYIFGFVSHRQYAELCAICNHGPELDAAAVEQRLGHDPIPAWDRRGLVAGAGGLLLLVLFAVLLRLSGPEIRSIPELTARSRSGDASAVAHLRREAEAGDLPSREALAELLGERGPAKFRDLEEAFAWTRAAAENGSPHAQAAVASLYERGVGTPRDTQEALRWYRAAAENGFVPAWNSLGALHLQGVGVPPNATEAVRWFRKAADAGDAPALFNLAICYLDGTGVDPDPAEAARRLEEAIRLPGEHPYFAAARVEASYLLGTLYEQGRGVEKDALHALHLYQAASPHHQEARVAVDRLRSRLETP